MQFYFVFTVVVSIVIFIRYLLICTIAGASKRVFASLVESKDHPLSAPPLFDLPLGWNSQPAASSAATPGFVATNSVPSMSTVDNDQARRAFEKVDTDGSGKLSQQEIRAFFKRHQVPISQQQIADAVLFADSNKDDQLDWTEFASVVRDICLSHRHSGLTSYTLF